MRILLVEDDDVVAELLKQSLTAQHYLVERASDGQMGWELAEAFEYNLILLDLMLPKLDGICFCQRLRSPQYPPLLNHNTPILLMTGETAYTKRVAGLDAGADDYISKPFDLDELLARVRALLRRGNIERSPLLIWEHLQLDPSLCQVRYRGQPIHLSSKEYKLLELFLRHPQRIFSHGTLIEHLWALEDIPTENAIRAQIKGVRKKLREVGLTDCIETVYGLGYRLKKAQLDEGGSELASERATSVEGHQELSTVPQSKLQPVSLMQTSSASNIHHLWQQYQPQYCVRLDVVEQAVSALHTTTLSEDLCQQAQREAHTLKGSLGLFGLEQGSMLSGEIEQLLAATDRLDPSQKHRLLQLTSQLRRIMLVSEPENQQSENQQSENQQPNLPTLSSEVRTRPRLLVIDKGEIAELESVVRAINLDCKIATTLSEVQLHLQQFYPDVVLLDLAFPGSTEQGFELLTQLAIQFQLPVVVLANEESLNDRVRVAQLGGKGFLQKPITASEITKAVVNVLRSSNSTSAKVLIVDDDAQLLEGLRQLLQPWGFQVTLLSQPQQLWQMLEQVEPDLLLLDIEMPELNGIDLCQVVRNDLRWGDLPILILSARNDEATVQQVFMAGADDYVSKPIRSAELVARVLARLERAKVLQKLRNLGGA